MWDYQGVFVTGGGGVTTHGDYQGDFVIGGVTLHGTIWVTLLQGGVTTHGTIRVSLLQRGDNTWDYQGDLVTGGVTTHGVNTPINPVAIFTVTIWQRLQPTTHHFHINVIACCLLGIWTIQPGSTNQ